MQLATFHHPTSHCNIPGVLGHSVNLKIPKKFPLCRRLMFPDYFSVSCDCSKNDHQEGFYNSYTHDNAFHALSVHEDSQNNTEDLQVTSDHVKHYILATIKIKNIVPENLPEIGLRQKNTLSNCNFRARNSERGKKVRIIWREQ